MWYKLCQPRALFKDSFKIANSILVKLKFDDYLQIELKFGFILSNQIEIQYLHVREVNLCWSTSRRQ